MAQRLPGNPPRTRPAPPSSTHVGYAPEAGMRVRQRSGQSLLCATPSRKRAVLDECMGPDNPVRFIDAFVDSLDLAGAGFERAEPKETGRPGYDPSDLLKLYIYGYLNRVRSSRRLEAETHRNLEVIWLLRRLRPNCKTIADFRRENREAFRQVFRDFVKVCRSLELFGPGS